MPNYIPFADWLQNYQKEFFRDDLVAGLTVAVVLVPQGMAYALLAGLPPIYGLYAGLVPLLIYPFFGSSRQLSVGPVALVSLLVISGLSQFADPFSEAFIQYAILTALVAGIIQVILSLLRLGFLINFLSYPVILGFTSAAALIIAINQFKYILGVEIPHGLSLLDTVRALSNSLSQANQISLVLGIISIIFILAMKRFKRSFPAALVVVVIAILLTSSSEWYLKGLSIVENVPKGLPAFTLPFLSYEMVIDVLPLALIICLISFIESLAIAKTISARHGSYPIHANKELFSLGFSKIAGSFFLAYPNTGSFTRSAINDEAGAKSGMSSILAAVVIALVLLFFTDFFYYLPKTVLAGIVIAAVVGLFNFNSAARLYEINKQDFLVYSLTFFLTLLLGIEYGVFAGMFLSILIILYKTSRPHYAELGRLPGTKTFKNKARFNEAEISDKVLVFRFDASLYFGNAEYFFEKINEVISKKGDPLEMIAIDMSSMLDIDSTGLQSLELLVDELQNAGITVMLTNTIGPVRDILKKSGLMDKIGLDNQFLINSDAVVNFLDIDKDQESQKYARQHNVKTKRKTKRKKK